MSKTDTPAGAQGLLFRWQHDGAVPRLHRRLRRQQRQQRLRRLRRHRR